MKSILTAMAIALVTLSTGLYAFVIEPISYESPNDAEEDTTPDLNIQAPQANETQPDIMTNPNNQNETDNNSNPIQSNNNQPDDINISPKTPGGPYY